ncbi:MAG: DUF2231 domain-containing protein [Elusimicrobiota bacterium]|jgi:uncharacterized membrane protein
MKRQFALTLLFLCSAISLFAYQGHPVHPESAFDPALLGFSGLREVFNLHPAFVHFPIALIPAALLLYFLGILLAKPALNIAGRACLYFSLISGIVAVWTGLIAQDSFPHNEVIHHMMQTHRTIGLILMVLLGLLTLWSFWHDDQRPRGAWAFILVLAGATYLVLQNGDLGSRMVYIEGAAVKPAIQAITMPEGEHRSHRHDKDESGSD